MKRTESVRTGRDGMGQERGSGDGVRAGRIASAVIGLAALVALGAGCGGTKRASLTPGASAPASVEALSTEPRVDLPGRVSVFLRVRNADGTPAADLTGADFDIFENGSLVSQTESFQQIRAQPQVFRSYMHLVLDRSNSVQASNAADVEAGAANFIEVVTQQESNYVKISWFDGSANLHPIAGFDFGFSNDKDLLLQAVAALNDEPPFSTSTNLYGAVIEGIADLDEVDAQAELDGVQNRSLALVTFTDGTHQSGSTPTLSEAVSAIQGTSVAGVPHFAFTIGVGSEIDPNVLVQLGPDGSVAAANFPVLTQAFQEVGDSVRRLANSFYFLTYCSPKTSGVHQLRISVGPPGQGGDANFEFDATGFGAGCAFLDVRNHPELANGEARAFLEDAVELPDGSVVGVGWRTSDCTAPGCAATATAFVARFQASAHDAPDASGDGRLDTSFGNGGFLDLEGPGFATSGATSVLWDDAGSRLLVGGWSRATLGGGPSQASLWAVAPDGSTAARTDLSNPGPTDQGVADLSWSPTGDLYAAGFRGAAARSFAVWKLFPDLSLDTGFGVDGVALEPAAPAIDNQGAKSLAIDSTGRVLAVGEAAGRIRVVALDGIGGTLDAGFGGTGVVEPVTTIGATTFGALCGEAAVDASDRLVIAGTLVRPGGSSGVREQPAIWRLHGTGAPDLSFAGSLSSPTHGTGVVTLRSASTNDPSRDFGRNTRGHSLAIAPDGSLLLAGFRHNAPPTPIVPNTDMIMLSFDENGVSRSGFNFVGFLIDDGASADDSYEHGSVVRVLSSGAIWTLGVSNPDDPSVPGGAADLPTVWVDREPNRVFAPLGTGGS